MKSKTFILCAVAISLLCVSAGVRQKKPSEILVELAKRPASAGKTLPLAPGRPASIIPLPVLAPAASRPFTRALVARPGVTNVIASWTCSIDWLGGEDTRAGLDVRACLTNCLRTGLADVTGPITNMPYAQSNCVTLPITKPTQQFKAYYGPKSQ